MEKEATMSTNQVIGQSTSPTLFGVVKQRSSSAIVWLALMGYLALVKVIITFFPAIFRSAVQTAVFDWPFLGVWTVAGLIGVWLAHRTGFPDAWDRRIGNRQRFLISALLGLGISLPFVAIDLLTHFTAIQAAQHGQPRENIDFPASVLIYPGGAVIVELIYRLFLVPLLLWLISNVALKGRWQAQVFWVLAFLTSLIEPLTQDMDMFQFGVGLMATVFLLDYLLNFLQAALFRKYGFLAAIVLRVAFYAVWHIVYVH